MGKVKEQMMTEQEQSRSDSDYVFIAPTDKQIELINDAIDNEQLSICCSAPLYHDICLACKEHSGVDTDTEDADWYYDNERVKDL